VVWGARARALIADVEGALDAVVADLVHEDRHAALHGVAVGLSAFGVVLGAVLVSRLRHAAAARLTAPVSRASDAIVADDRGPLDALTEGADLDPITEQPVVALLVPDTLGHRAGVASAHTPVEARVVGRIEVEQDPAA